jgi:hypothetical protein
VLANFGDPDAPRVNGGKLPMPYLVWRRYEKGKTLYVGSGELWRLRGYKEAYYERFLTKLARFVSSGAGAGKAGRFEMGPEYVTGNITVEAVVLDKDGNPINPATKPEVEIIRPAGFDEKTDRVTPKKITLTAKKVEGKRWYGLFAGSFPAETPGQYVLKIDAGGGEPFTHTFNVIAPNVEMGNLRTNFEHLYQMATPAAPVLEPLDEARRDRIQTALTSARAGLGKDAKGPRLFFKLASAHLIPELLVSVPPKVNSTKGKYEDLWDKGTQSGWELPFHYSMMIGVGAIGLLASLILFVIGRWIVGTVVVGVSLLTVLGFFLADVIWTPPWAVLPIEMSYVLGAVVGLFCVEWLTRKLLKLA